MCEKDRLQFWRFCTCEERRTSTVLKILKHTISTIVCGNGWLQSHLESAMTRMNYGQSDQWKGWVMASLVNLTVHELCAKPAAFPPYFILRLYLPHHTSYYLQHSGEQLSSIASSADNVALKQVHWGCTYKVCMKLVAPFSAACPLYSIQWCFADIMMWKYDDA